MTLPNQCEMISQGRDIDRLGNRLSIAVYDCHHYYKLIDCRRLGENYKDMENIFLFPLMRKSTIIIIIIIIIINLMYGSMFRWPTASVLILIVSLVVRFDFFISIFNYTTLCYSCYIHCNINAVTLSHLVSTPWHVPIYVCFKHLFAIKHCGHIWNENVDVDSKSLLLLALLQHDTPPDEQ